MTENENEPETQPSKPTTPVSLQTQVGSVSNFLNPEELLQVNTAKRFNFHFLESHLMLFTSGRSFQLLNFQKLEIRKIFSTSTGGIGAVAVHPSKKIIAVAEKGANPAIFIYEFPSLNQISKLSGGTERSFKHVEFSPNGDKLASLGSSPDYSLAIWDWKNQLLNLKAKAFSQDIFRVSFSKFCDDVLVTSGIGHIKFWQVAFTFTGLKLKGYIGKFGAVEMSDISAFEVFPDEKVLSGSESGHLLLWDAHFIKAVLHTPGAKPCHE